MATPKKNNGENGGSEKPTLTFLPGGRKTKRKRTYTKVARLQINRKYQQLERTNQLELPSRKTRQTIEETRKPISKLIRMRRNPKNREQVLRATLTTEGKLLRVLFRGSSKRWEDMNELRRERYRRMVVETLAKQTQTVSRRKGNEKKTIRQVRENILPELERTEKRLAENIRINEGKVTPERIVELRNMQSVVQGIVREMKTKTIPRERALVPFVVRTRERETIPFPGEDALRRMNARISFDLERAARGRSETRERIIPPAGNDEKIFDEIKAKLASENNMKKYPRSMQAIEDYAAGKISHDKARQIMANETGIPSMQRKPAHESTGKIVRLRKAVDIPILGRIGPEKDLVYFTPTFEQRSTILPHTKYTAEQKRIRISKFMQKQPNASFVRGYSWYPRWVGAVQKARAIRRAAKVKTIAAWRATRKRRQK